MKKIWSLIFFLLIVVSGGIFLWKMIISPGYSLKQLDRALKEHNVIAFNKYVDLDATVDSIIVQTWQYYRLGGETGKLWDEIRNKIGNIILSAIKPNMKEIIKQKVLDYISTGQGLQSNSESQDGISSLVIELIKGKINPEQWDYQSINYIEIEDKIAQVGITYFDKAKETNFLLEIKMRNMEGYWQIIEISNVAQILNMYQNVIN